MVCLTSQFTAAHAYLLVALGTVLGAASVAAVATWRRARALRERERYFSDVSALARRGGR